MRRALLSLVLMGLSSPVFAQQRGTIALDAMTTPGRHFGIGYYVTDHLSLRPSLGIGYSDYAGVFVTAGADLRYELSPERNWTVYAAGSVLYRGGQNASYAAAETRPRTAYTNYDGMYYGAGLGVQRRVNDRLSFLLDGRYLHTASGVVSSSSFGQFRLDAQNQIVASLGLSFNLR